ncbi:hypothetical protein CRU98_03150 [Arcobacter sp. CECT 8986]|uniref:tetratricopeptide repeat protein n=1 Tax=Arcobacter sp. CECT 8986 TaxID=2044507 RepID=UPI001009A25E|nr:tetratricopeptide repeat protein [Arcobacter sp. CECT 8986]RXK00167.1 hypothetical protein CRU98_03150 [Arcobacter sp. CECT 8986]
MIFKYFLLVCFLFNLCFSITFDEAKQVEQKDGVIKALNLYKELAKQENTEAIHRLAYLYTTGKGVPKNYEYAYVLLLKGATLGDFKCAYDLVKLYMNKDTIYYDEINAYNLLSDLVNAKYAPAENMVGVLYLKGMIVQKDYKKAVTYFERASKQGYALAHCYLAYMYASGKGVFANFGRAHIFAKEGMKHNIRLCEKVYKDYNLKKYPEDKGFKFNFYTKPPESKD